ncbi:MAG TPA: XamI family restriction endonuclease [Phycisphaerae bacterium]
MKTERINADKPHLWKADVAASVDQFNRWFMQFAPEAFRKTRVTTTEHVKAALLATDDLRQLTPDMLKAHPDALPTLRMATAPPLAVDRLIGLANVSKNLVGRMEEGKLPTKMNDSDRDTELTAITRVVIQLLDRDIFPWLESAKTPGEHERTRAATIVADRLCRAGSDVIVRGARKRHQFSVIAVYLESRGYRQVVHPLDQQLPRNDPGTYTLGVRVPLVMGRESVMAADMLIEPHDPNARTILLDVRCALSFAAANRHSASDALKFREFHWTYHDHATFAVMLGGYFDPGYLGTQAAEGSDWIWQHRLEDLATLGV